MIKAILTDIEGTTSSLSFVKEVLFPYARARLADYVGAHRDNPEVRRCLDEVRAIAGMELTDAQVIQQLIRWIDEDRKITPLKALQGLIWEHGYKENAFQGHVYDDAAVKLRVWKQSGLRLFVYSSGSVYAQKLIFGHTAFGDLTPLFEGYFDTTVGGKREADSYRKITAAINVPPQDILFLSDIKEELDAATAAGLQTVWLVRDGAVDTHAAHHQVRDFNSIEI
jgi:enolase-phosphatase E1